MDHALLQRYRIQLSDPLEIRIIFGQHYSSKIKLRYRQTVFFEFGRDFFVQLRGDFIEMLVDFEYVDL